MARRIRIKRGHGVPPVEALEEAELALDLSSAVLYTRIGSAVVPVNVAPSVKRDIGRRTFYPPFTPTGIDDEFDDDLFSGWTAVNSGTNPPVILETNDRASVFFPGPTSTAAQLYAQMKADTINIGEAIETCFQWSGPQTNFHGAGLIFADGATYAAGNQVIFRLSLADDVGAISSFTGYNAQTGPSFTAGIRSLACGKMFMRLKYDAANSWRAYISSDGISWGWFTPSGSAFSRTLTPTHLGFFTTAWGAGNQFSWSFLYFRKVTM